MNTTCFIGGATPGRGLPYHNHMMMHVRRGEATVKKSERGRNIYERAAKQELPLLKGTDNHDHQA